MSRIDIRNGHVDSPSTITFADGHSDYFASEVTLNKDYGEVTITFLDCDGDKANQLKFEDIDNLILALKKAKELWGDK